MVEKYKSYPEYKNSGVDWLGKIPTHFICTNLKRYCNTTDGSHHSPKIVSEGLPFVSVTDVSANNINFHEAKKISVKDFERLVNEGCKPSPGDVLLTKDGTIGRACIVEESMPDFVILSSLGLLTPKAQLLKRFLYYYLVSGINIDQMNSLIHGSALRRMTIGKINDLFVLLPSNPEQQKISDFLDHETAKIDRLIAKQERLIELLKEKRQAVISHAVTKGLNPDAPLRPSGIDWLGDIPAHWEATQLKFYTLAMQTGPFGSQLHADDYVDDGIPLINPAHLLGGKIKPDESVTVDKATQKRLSRHMLSQGDLILARRGELGRCAVVNKAQEGWLCGTGSLKAKLGKKLIPEYSYFLISSQGVVSELSLESKGSTMDNLNTETLGRTRIPVPPVNEQADILEYIDVIAGKFQEIIQKSKHQMELLKERRTALISAAVTGKIDVCDWEPPKDTDNKKEQAA